MTRSFKRIAFKFARAIVLSILLVGALVIAYCCFRIASVVAGAIADAWHAELCIPLLMLVAGVCLCGLAGHLLGDDGRSDVQRPRKLSKT